MADSVGGLYVAVGVDGDKAIHETKQLHEGLLLIARDLQRLGSSANFNAVTQQLKAVNAEVARTQRAVASAGSNGTVAKTMQKQINNAHTAAIAEDARRTAAMRQNAVQQVQTANKTAVQTTRAAQKAADAQVRAAAGAARKQMALLQGLAIAENRLYDKRARAAEHAAAREIRANKAAQSSRIGGVKRGLADFATGGAAAASGNPAYAIANVVQGLTKMSSAMGLVGASGGVMATGIGIGVAAVVALTVAAVVLEGALVAIALKLAQFGIQTAASFETLQLQLEGLLGSAKRGREEMKFLLDLGQQSVVPTESLIAADRQLAAFGVEVTSQRRQLVRFISDFGTATSATETQIYFLSLAIGQVAARGKADMVDIKQLGNAGITSRNIYKAVAQEIGTSWQKVRDGVKDGIISSDALINGIIKMGGKYQETAEKARKSTNGLLANIKDVITVGLGRAFAGLNKQFGSILQGVMKIVQSINFDRIAIAVQNFFTMIQVGFGGINQTGGDATYFFNHTLPQAIEYAGIVVAGFIKAFRIGWESVMIAFNASKGVFAGMGLVMVGVVQTLAAVLDKANLISDEMGQSVTDWAASTNKTLNGWLQESVDGVISASKEINEAWSIPSFKWLSYQITATQVGINNGQVPSQANDPQTPEIAAMLAGIGSGNNKPPPLPTTPSSGGSGSTKVDPRIAAAKKVLDDYKEIITKAISARQTLFDAFNIPFKEKLIEGGVKPITEAFKAFSSGDVDSIVGKYKELHQAIIDFYAPGLDEKMSGGKTLDALRAKRKKQIAFLKEQTGELIRLAAVAQKLNEALAENEKINQKNLQAITDARTAMDKQYDRQKLSITNQYDGFYTALSATQGSFTKGSLAVAQEALDAAVTAYESAQARLDDLIAARDDFLSSLRDSAFSFVNDLSEITQEITKYTRLDDVGSFSSTTTQESSLASFRDGLQKRLDVLKKWAADVRTLMARGLNGDLLQSLIQQGPESASSVTGQLASAGDAELKDINDIQAQLATEISGIQKASSAQWFDAGIAAQQAFTAPLKAAMEAAQTQVDELTRQKDLALGILEAWHEDQNAMFDQQQLTEDERYQAEKDRLTAALAANQASAEAVALTIDARLSGLPDTAYASGLNTIQGLIDGLKDDAKLTELKAAAAHVARVIKNTINDDLGVHSRSAEGFYTGQMVGLGLSQGLDDTVTLVEQSANQMASAALSALPVGGHGASDNNDMYVLVQIGDEPIKTLVKAERVSADQAAGRYVLSGRRV